MTDYESERLVAEYLSLHYGTAEEVLPFAFGPRDSLGFPVRCVNDCLDSASLPAEARALDVGCAVGRASFELARYCASVNAIDRSRRFIAAANALRDTGTVSYDCVDEGLLTTRRTANVPTEIRRERVAFETGDALDLRPDLGRFDVVLAANLICRLPDPARFLRNVADIVTAGGQFILTTPCTWLDEFTSYENWLGGFVTPDGRRITTFATVSEILGNHFDLLGRKDLPFLIREHARKYPVGCCRGNGLAKALNRH